VLRAYVLGIHTETTILIYIPEFDLEMPLILNETSLPGHPKNHCDYDNALHKMKVIWYNNDQETVQVLEFLSVVDVCIGADMKVVKPVLLVELLHPNV
jgi:hypothetical protein